MSKVAVRPLKEAFLKKYFENKCYFTQTCKELGLETLKVKLWIADDRKFREAKGIIELQLAEEVEQHLLRGALGDKTAGLAVQQIYFLKNNHPKYREWSRVQDYDPKPMWFLPEKVQVRVLPEGEKKEEGVE